MELLDGTLSDYMLAKHSSTFFTVKQSHDLEAFGGVYYTTMISPYGYFWLHPLRLEFTLARVRQLVKLARDALAAFPEVARAEAAKTKQRDQKFLVACGFTQIDETDDRYIYEWTTPCK